MKKYDIILVNDENNSFTDVIAALVGICQHNPYQAEQCAMFVHKLGEYTIKNNIVLDDAIQYKDLLTQVGLNIEMKQTCNN